MSSELDITRARILAAALACAADVRPDFTMAEVAAKAGLSRQAVYLHFRSRAALLAALMALLEKAAQPPTEGPSARAALSIMVSYLADTHPRDWPLAKSLGGAPGDASRLAACSVLAGRFQKEGALSPHLSLAAATDLLATLTSLAVWAELVPGRGWDKGRYRTHIVYLATSALTK